MHHGFGSAASTCSVGSGSSVRLRLRLYEQLALDVYILHRNSKILCPWRKLFRAALFRRPVAAFDLSFGLLLFICSCALHGLVEIDTP